jgi:hypothetical protein
MSFKTAIWNAPIFHEHADEKGKLCHIGICYNGHCYFGDAALHDDDKDFFSEKVGLHLAHMRAVKQAARVERDAAYKEWKILEKAFKDATFNLDEKATAANQLFKDVVIKAQRRYERRRDFVKELNWQICQYINAQDKAITSIKRQRELRAKQDNNN